MKAASSESPAPAVIRWRACMLALSSALSDLPVGRADLVLTAIALVFRHPLVGGSALGDAVVRILRPLSITKAAAVRRRRCRRRARGERDQRLTSSRRCSRARLLSRVVGSA